jgi:hypothetical protein
VFISSALNWDVIVQCTEYQSVHSISVVDSLEMLDKIDPPSIPDGYGISVAYACLLDIIRTIALTIEGGPPSGSEQPETVLYQGSEEDRELHSQLINSSWCGLLAALSPLIDARYSTVTIKVPKSCYQFVIINSEPKSRYAADPC